MELTINEKFIESIRDETQLLLFSQKWASFKDMQEINRLFEDIKNIKIKMIS